MICCGITGHTGNLGKKFIKIANNFKYIKFKGDIRKKKDVEKWIKNNNFDLIVHFAAVVPISMVNKNYKLAMNVNFNGTKNLIKMIKKYNSDLKWFFYSSSSHVYAYSKRKIKENYKLKPITKYGRTKLNAENLIIKEFKNTNIRHCIGRIFSIIDNKNKEFFLKSLINKIKNKNKIVKLDNLNHYRDFISTEQISKIIILLWKKKYSGIINIANGKKTNLKKIAIQFAKKSNKKIFFNKNIKTCMIANINKLKNYGWKSKELNFIKYF
tara:strand:- start:139 stop:945 length:807 start_codon:yes stop_codon:yes gene_type:complete